MIKIMAAIAVLLAAGCSSGSMGILGGSLLSRPYSYNAYKSDPVLVFTSDFSKGSAFFVNFDPSTVNDSSKDFKSGRNFMYVGSVNNYGRLLFGYYIPATPEQKEFTIQVPADQVIVVRAQYSYIEGGECGPVQLPFTPKKGHTYKVNMNEGTLHFGSCFISINDANNPKSPTIWSDAELVRYR